MVGFRGMTKKEKAGMIKYWQSNFGLNFAIDPKIKFGEIPLPFRNRMYFPSKRKKNDPIAFQKINKTIHTIY